MKSSLILASLCASLALAKPINKRDDGVATQIVYEYYTITVTGTGPSPTAAVANAGSDAGAGAFFSADKPADVPAVPTPAAIIPSTGNTNGLSAYAKPILEQHNIHRANHSVSPLEWDDNLAAIAQTIGQTCVYAHKTDVGGISYGQNIGAGYDDAQVPNMITNGMYNNEMGYYARSYGFDDPQVDFGKVGHFTQIVWAGTQKVGCATVHCPGGLANAGGMLAAFTVCNYSPAGNVKGAYGKNVFPPLGQAYVSL